ncbi:MAG: nucleotidyltransferase [Desulfobacterales bacterium]|nr:nucleotidyltransferase [Desulfobacterales bacterium]
MNFKEVLKVLIKKFQKQKIDFALSGGLALSTMGIFRFTKDIDFLVHEKDKSAVQEIMTDIGYDKQHFSTDEIISYVSPLKIFGQVDFLLARRKYTQAMLKRAKKTSIFSGQFELKTILPEDLIGLKIQAIANDPVNRFQIDAPDIQRLLSLHFNKLDIEIIREYFAIFNKEELLNEWILDIKL